MKIDQSLICQLPGIPWFPKLLGKQELSADDVEIMHALLGARTTHQCNELFWMAIRRFRVGKFACGEIDVRKRERAVFYSIQWSEAWRRFYLANLMERDPMLAALNDRDEPFTWRELRNTGTLSPQDTAIFDVVARHGWIDGFVLPVRRSGSHVALVSLGCEEPLDAAAAKHFLTCASLCYLKRIRAVIHPSEFPVPPMGMAPRELECLGLVARGYSDHKIASTLGISIPTAHEYVQRAMQRIGVKTRTEAVAIAISFGAIRL